jgi:hypothetical protein
MLLFLSFLIVAGLSAIGYSAVLKGDEAKNKINYLDAQNCFNSNTSNFLSCARIGSLTIAGGGLKK